jgi:hypothetical protein
MDYGGGIERARIRVTSSSRKGTIAVVLTNTFTEKSLLRGGKSRGLARVLRAML